MWRSEHISSFFRCVLYVFSSFMSFLGSLLGFVLLFHSFFKFYICQRRYIVFRRLWYKIQYSFELPCILFERLNFSTISFFHGISFDFILNMAWTASSEKLIHGFMATRPNLLHAKTIETSLYLNKEKK